MERMNKFCARWIIAVMLLVVFDTALDYRLHWQEVKTTRGNNAEIN